MKRLIFTLKLLIVSLCVVSCSEEAKLNPNITTTTTDIAISDEEQIFEIKFNSAEEWAIKIKYNEGDEQWIDPTRYVGGVGEQAVEMTALKNYSGASRSAVITVESFGKTSEVVVSQQKIEYEQRRAGMYVLHEGWFGQGNSKISLYDPATKTSTFDYFGTQNDGKELGDVANDVIVYGGKTYVVVNNSDKIVVMNAYSGKLMGTIDLVEQVGVAAKPRYAVGAEGDVYVSTWHSGVLAIDTTSLMVDHKIELSQAYSEGIVYHEGSLYVANSGLVGDPYGGEGNTISIVSLDTQAETGTITVDKNPNILKIANDGKMYLSTWGNYFSVEATLHEIDYKNKSVVKSWAGFPTTKFDVTDKYIYGYNFSYISYQMYFTRIDRASGVASAFDYTVADQLRSVHSVSADPQTNDVFFACQSGWVAWFDEEGTLKEQFDPTDESPVGANTTKIVFRDLMFEK